MKNKLMLPAIMVLFLFACKKESNTTPVVKETETAKQKYPVDFSLSSFTESSTPLSTKDVNSLSSAALKDQILYLYYFVYKLDENSAYSQVSHAVQTSSDPNFGTLKDTLEKGQYAVYFIGTRGPGYMNFLYISSSVRTDPIFFYSDKHVHDTFLKGITLNVGGPTTQAVELSRVASELTVKITDRLPANAKTIKLMVADFPGGLDITSGKGQERGHEQDGRDTLKTSFAIPNGNIGNKGFTVSQFVWASHYNLLQVDCLDATGKVIATKKLPKNTLNAYTMILPNTHYTFSGALFSPETGFTVSADGEWNAPVNTPF
jgi:hypothetical protein